jgi:K+-sensing histidine kinase KdpD
MKIAPETQNEKERILALQRLNILDSKPEEEYDEITKLASILCDVPTAFISLIDKDRQWLKSRVGITACETGRDISFCSHTILEEDGFLEIPDSTKDERFKDNPLACFGEEKIIFYAGVALKDNDDNILGTLCVADQQPRKLTSQQKESLRYLANQVIRLFEMRTANYGLRQTKKELKEKNEQLKDFAGVVSHDMKMPLANMIVTIDILKSKLIDKIDEASQTHLQNLKHSAFKLSDYISNILAHYESDKLIENNQEEHFDFQEMLDDINDMLDSNEESEIKVPEKPIELVCNRVALEQVFLNLMSNSIKYNDKDVIKIKIDFERGEKFYHFTISDNGMGIPKDKQKEIFSLFKTVAEKDRKGQKGNGIGLSTVKKIINDLGGDIEVDSEENEGTTFQFYIKHFEEENKSEKQAEAS